MNRGKHTFFTFPPFLSLAFLVHRTRDININIMCASAQFRTGFVFRCAQVEAIESLFAHSTAQRSEKGGMRDAIFCAHVPPPISMRAPHCPSTWGLVGEQRNNERVGRIRS